MSDEADLAQTATSRTWQVTPDLLSVINMQGMFEATNPAWQTTLGWTKPELQAPFLQFLHPDDIDRSLAVFEDAKRGNPVLRFENRYQHKNGSYRWLSWVGVLEGGKIYCSARDITADKENAALLAEHTRERDMVWDASTDLLCVANFDGYFIRLNPAWSELLDWTEDELKSKPFLDFVHPDDHVATVAAASTIAEDQPVFTFENRYRHRDGSYRWLSWNAVPREGQIYATVRDVTKAKAQMAALLTAEEALRQAQKLEAVGQLTGGVAHDFNNLLTVIKSSTDLLKRPNLPAERRDRYIGAISDTVDRAAKLTGQLLAFARRQALRPEVFDVGHSVRNIGDMLSTLTGSRIEITLRVPDVPCFINADASQFDTALVNMVVNARDAMNGEGRLSLSVVGLDELPEVRAHPAKQGRYVAVTVSDTGSGIHPDQIDKIFEPFFTTKEIGQGTGLGLSQVFGFAKQSGGEVMVESELGSGTTFTLYLPKTTIKPRLEVEDDDLLVVDGEGTCVLVIEDNREVGQFSSQTLNELGYGTHLVANGKEALAELASSPDAYHVVFSDVVMPGMNGVDLGREIRRLYPGLPIILTSGYSSVLAEDPTHGFELLQKPYSVEQISRVLRRAAAKGQKRYPA